jgi:hypothetical protein
MRKGACTGVMLAAVAALTLSACGSSSNTSATNAAVSTTTSSTSSTTSFATAEKAKSKKKKTTQHKTTTSKTTTKKTTTTSKTTTSKTTTTTSTTTHTTSKTTTTAALEGPIQATLVGENHTPKIGVKWSYTVTAKDANGKPLSGKIETEFVYGGAVVGKEAPFTHTLTDGSITNQVTFPARAKGVTGLSLQVIVITSIGQKTLDWSVTPTTK